MSAFDLSTQFREVKEHYELVANVVESNVYARFVDAFLGSNAGSAIRKRVNNPTSPTITMNIATHIVIPDWGFDDNQFDPLMLELDMTSGLNIAQNLSAYFDQELLNVVADSYNLASLVYEYDHSEFDGRSRDLHALTIEFKS